MTATTTWILILFLTNGGVSVPGWGTKEECETAAVQVAKEAAGKIASHVCVNQTPRRQWELPDTKKAK